MPQALSWMAVLFTHPGSGQGWALTSGLCPVRTDVAQGPRSGEARKDRESHWTGPPPPRTARPQDGHASWRAFLPKKPRSHLLGPWSSVCTGDLHLASLSIAPGCAHDTAFWEAPFSL